MHPLAGAPIPHRRRLSEKDILDTDVFEYRRFRFVTSEVVANMRLGRNFDRPRKHNRVRIPTLEKTCIRPLRQLADVVGSTAPENENGRHSISGTYDGPIRLTATLEMSVNHVME